jgi:hypothetical protein
VFHRLAATAAIALVLAPIAAGASLHQVRATADVRRAQLHRDRGTVRFMLRHRWSRSHPGFMRLEKQAEHRIVVELASLHRLRQLEGQLLRPPPQPVDIAAWQPTVDCENSGQWADSPGYFYLGLQFDPGTWASAVRATGVSGTSPHDQVINAEWTGREARREGAPDPWPNCPDPYYG